MTDHITRELLTQQLGDVRLDQFLCYLMGPYKSFNLNYILDEDQRQDIDPEDLPGPLRRLFKNKDSIADAKALLRRVQGHLRTDPGVNAFLAVDVNVDVEDVDAVTQSIEYTRCSNATAFIVPYLGHNFGVGEETGSVLEAETEAHSERVIFMHEDDVTSAMISSARDRWGLRVATYDSEAELIEELRAFTGEIQHREQRGDLPRL